MVTWNFTEPILPGARFPVRTQSIDSPEMVALQPVMSAGNGAVALSRQADAGLTQQANGDPVKLGTLS